MGQNPLINRYPEVNQVNASITTVFRAPALRVGIIVAAAFFPARLGADTYAIVRPLPTGAPPAFSAPAPDQRAPLDGGWQAGRDGELGDIRPEAEPARQDEKKYPKRRYAFFCFGPAFGTSERGIDPNFMPPPSVTDVQTSSSLSTVRYTRAPSNGPGRATWVGNDGSTISYSVKNGGRGEADESLELAERRSVADLVAENRTEMTKISWNRAYKKYPELGVEDSPERAAFEVYLAERRAEPLDAPLFERPMWPEEVCAAFMAEWNWKKAEAESWDRVRAKIRIFNDPESIYTRRFMEFTQDLRAYPEGAAIFDDPTWPEKVLELHDQKLGPVPARFR